MDGEKPKIKEITLDVLKPHQPSIVDLSREVMARLKGIKKVQIEVLEMDQDTESIKMRIYCDDLEVDELIEVLNELGASLHSIDGVTVERD